MAKKPKQYPFEVWSGQSLVTIYRAKISGKDRYQLRWQEAGEMERKTYSDPEAANIEALTIANRLAAGEAGAITLNSDESAIYRRAVKACAGVPLDVACREWADARAKLEGASFSEVVADYAKRTRGETVTVSKLIELFKADRIAHKVTDVYLKRFSYRLEKISAAFGQRSVREVTEAEIRRFVDAQKGGLRNRKNMRDGIVTLWRFARRERYLPRDLKTEAELVEAPAVKRKDRIDIFTPDEMAKLLAAAFDHIKPIIAICGFAGVRSQGEITRLQWEDIKWDRNVIDVAGKTGERRYVPMQPNLAAWLAPFRDKKGPVATVQPDKAFLRTSRTAGLKWKHNALRHSYGSYRVAITKSVDQTSLEMGNSTAMVKKNYLEAVTEDQAAQWFCVMPSKV